MWKFVEGMFQMTEIVRINSKEEYFRCEEYFGLFEE